MNRKKRRSYEAGHKAKFLVVVDDTPECSRAVYFASRRAARTGVKVTMLHVIGMHDSKQQWLGVADIMRAEAHETAKALLDQNATLSTGITGVVPERTICEGETVEEVIKLINEDEDIALLVLGAGTGKDGPGPLVSSIGKSGGMFPIPVAIVPGDLTDEELDALS